MGCPNDFENTDPFAATLLSEDSSGVHRKSPLASAERPQRLPPEGVWPTDQDTALFLTFQEAGLLSQMNDGEALRMASDAGGLQADGRVAVLLDSYYGAGGDSREATRRFREDIYLRVSRRGNETPQGLLVRIANLVDGLDSARFERLGTHDESLLLLRAGDQFRFVDEDDCGEGAGNLAREIVRAVNSLCSGPRKLVSLGAHAGVERFVGLRRTGALVLLRAGVISPNAFAEADFD